MSKRIFLDVGANTGQTLLAVLDPIYRFDLIVCFEPASVCWPRLEKAAGADSRVRIAKHGLWNKYSERTLFDPGSKGASIWKKDQWVEGRGDLTESCMFHDASVWFQLAIAPNDTVFMKLNCEGAECDILDDLLDSGEFEKVSYVMIDFDVRKIGSQKHREAELRERLRREGYEFPRVAFTKDVMVGPTHQARIQNWLRLIGAGE
jgi:FkbM family methyltransferase